ncbi:DUF2235 domain-containing protein [Oxalobacteraceae bacterium OTU3CINTB1]|nr:DUF2235 domain-containing protein [Oxalobacteraceae bacterium OTU3CINTB1]
MANEAIPAAEAASRDVPDEPAGPFQDCRDVVHISLFFDGTGNNFEADMSEQKWSNVGRLMGAMRQQDNVYPIYVSGVGTKFNGTAGNWLDAAGIWIEDHIEGLGFGGGGERRLRHGEDGVNERLFDALLVQAKAQGLEVEQYAAAGTAKGMAKVHEALAKHRLIKMIDMSFFGFSRGAALARAFSHRIITKCKQNGTDLLLENYPMRPSFLGIFDTVASFGIPAHNVQLPFRDRELVVSPLVERCVHYVAAHEVRVAFPVDLIRKNGKLAGEWVENVYPGVHSDVGGGYAKKDQQVSNNYARIPMRDMLREAVFNGVRMKSYREIEKTTYALFQERFECLPETEAAYRDYMAACGAMSGTVENQMKRHLEVFYSASGTIDRRGIETPGDRSRADSTFKSLGPRGMAWEVNRYREVAKAGEWMRIGGVSVNSYAQYLKLEDWQLSAWDKPASNGVVNFVSQFIHDSKVDFIGNIEPFSYFKPRGVWESNVSVWTEWGNWVVVKSDAVSKTVGDAYESGKQQVGEAVDATTKAAKDTAAAAQRKAEEAAEYTKRKAEEAAAYTQRKAKEAADYARQKADEAAAAAKRAYDATAKAANDAAEAAQHQAQEAAAYARRKAQEASDAVEGAYNATTKAGRDAAAAGAKKIGDIEDGAERLYDRGMNWIKRTVKGQ